MKESMEEQTLYKLTDQNCCTFGGTQWGPCLQHRATGDRKQGLCSDGWIHAYESPLLAVFMNPIHACFDNPILWEARGIIEKRDGQLACGCRVLTTVRELPLPVITEEQLIKFAIYCALEVYEEEHFVTWAINWLSGDNRSKDAASMASARARSRSGAARSGAPAWAARAALWVVPMVEDAARATAWAADEANKVKEIDFISLAQRAVS